MVHLRAVFSELRWYAAKLPKVEEKLPLRRAAIARRTKPCSQLRSWLAGAQNGDNKFQRTQFWSRFSRKTPLNSLDLINGFRCFDDPWNQKFEDPLLQRSSPWLQRTTYSPAGRWTGRWIQIGQDFVCLLGLRVDYTSGCQSKLSCGKSGVNY